MVTLPLGSGAKEGGKSSGRRARLTGLVWVCLLIVAVIAAWGIHDSLLRESETGNSPGLGERTVGNVPRDGAPTSQAWERALSTTAPAPAAVAGLTATGEDIREVSVPEGAVRQWAYERRTEGGVEQVARYRWKGEMGAAMEHFRRRLSDGGFKTLSEDATDGYKLRVLKGKHRVAVSLRKGGPEGKMVEITVASLRWP
jgi:hypothetical protein